MTNLSLQHGLPFADLYDRNGLVRLDRAFVAHLSESDIGLHDRLMTARRGRAVKSVKESAAVAIDGPGLAQELDRVMSAAADEPVGAWERRYAEHVANWLEDEAGNAEALDIAQRYAAWATLSPEGRRKHR